MPEIKNEMILASAGSGKTYQLTNRFIALMAAGVPPERIIALTFTRKAAGEFFQAILEKLAGAATDSEKSRTLSEDIGSPALTCDDYLRFLGELVANMHRLNLGTLDSFFVRIIQTFPFEFGLGGGFEIIGDHELAKSRSRVYRKVFNRQTDANSRHQFLQSFKESTHGQEGATLVSVLDRFVENHHELFLEAPEQSLWGTPDSLWPDPATGFRLSNVDLTPAWDRLFAHFESDGIKEKQLPRWKIFRDELERHSPGNPYSTALKYLLEKLLEPDNWDAIRSGTSSITLTVERVKQEISPEVCKELHTILTAFLAAEFENRFRRTSGIWEILHHYESEYSKAVRRLGKLTFFDLQLVLSGAGFDEPESRVLLSQTPDADARLQIDYRLDAQFDHWLLDEFQDTNYHQWSVVKNLIDEAIQDVSDTRSLFYVGDVKQAIYAWRGGDVRLFREIFDHYNQHGDRIVERPLNESWRSGPAVIEMVNRVFGAHETLAELFPGGATERWEWQPHVSRKTDLGGYACLLNPADPEGDKNAARHRVVLGILDEIRPTERDLSCAILVKSNDQCHAVAEYIRAYSEHPVFVESDATIATDSPAAAALLALLQFAAHPGDTLAGGHIKMTPLAGVLAQMKLGETALVRRVLTEISNHGFEHFFRTWAGRLKNFTGKELDPFNRLRVEQLAEAAQAFDADGDRDIDAFLEFAGGYKVRDTVAAGFIQVMTVHKSKGLGFDLVILPELQGNTLTTARDGIGVKRNAEREVEWILDLPPKDIATTDPGLRRHREGLESDACYEELCKLYVAMTRAKRAMYLITDPVGKSTSNNFPKVLLETLGDVDEKDIEIGGIGVHLVHAAGDPSWHTKLPPKIVSDTAAELETAKAAPVLAPRPFLPRRTPSGSESHAVTAKELFSRGGTRSREFGTAVHALFEQIEWADGLAVADFNARFQGAPIPESIRDEAEAHVLRCLSHPEALDALTKPSSKATCWLEKKFELVLDGEWISGTFDRVVVEPDLATILDFKTDRVADDDAVSKAVAGYRPQLALYRRVLSRLTGLPSEKIKTLLLFTRPARVVEAGK